MVNSEVIYFWQKDAEGNYHLCAREIISADGSLEYEHNLTVNQIAADPAKTDFMSGLLRILAGAIVASSGPHVAPANGPASVATSVPVCPDHGGQMDASRYKAQGAFASFYCKKRNGEKFCKQQADVWPDGTTTYRTTKAG